MTLSTFPGGGGAVDDFEGESSQSATEQWQRPQQLGRVRGGSTSRAKLMERDDTSSSSYSSTSHSPRRQRWQPRTRGVRLKSRSRGLRVSPGGRVGNECFQDLALPLGMCFAAVVAQVLFGKNISGDRIDIESLIVICTSAVKESITAIYGRKFDCFLINFEKSFHSTLKTLGLINEVSVNKQNNVTSSSSVCQSSEKVPDLASPQLVRTIKDFKEDVPLNYANNQLKISPDLAHPGLVHGFKEDIPLNYANNQIILHGHASQHLANVYSSTSGIQFSQSILSTMDRSVIEQTRSNELKAVEIELAMQKLQLKRSQLALSSHANYLEKVKISLGISKASFKEEKLKNQMEETRYAQLLQRCMDLLVAGLIIMCVLLLYGASIYSYQRITEVTSACESVSTESRSWWMPKAVLSFNSGMAMLRCHVVALTRMSFGILMILAIAYVAFQRTGSSAPTMPLTFIVLLLGALCGFSGKLCIDTLGGNGFQWLIYWEVLCMLHFCVNVFPSAFYHILYGPVIVSQGANSVMLPYRMIRYMFYAFLLLIIPTAGGLLPFASFSDWMVHFLRS
ncbi:protein CPR-5-like [Canna indica]|uniref:Protein CPR-5-like n=1 Tax=Canna indica TaxID=4628 RepID=A0AAQ3KY37_9LILI|nr:protein CPR-5-like [Canna indica]